MRRALTTAATARTLASSSRLAPAQRARPVIAATRLPAQVQVRQHSHAAPAPVVAPPVSPENTYDIVIIGGGPAGLALANALVSQPSLRDGARTLLLEGGPLDPVRNWDDQGPWSNRVSSLTAENIAWIDSEYSLQKHGELTGGIGAWKHIAQDRSREVDDIIVWANPDADSTPMLHFPGPDLARMTENVNLQRALLRHLDEVKQTKGHKLEIREKTRVGDIAYTAGRGSVALNLGGEWVQASLLIGADGPNSPARKFAQIDTFGHGYNAHGVVATLETQRDVYGNHTAFQRFLPTGPIAYLPLGDETTTMVWSTTPEIAAALKALSPEALTEMVNAAFSLSENELKLLTEAVLTAHNDQSAMSAEGIRSIMALFERRVSDAPRPPLVRSVDPKSVASFPLKLAHADKYIDHRVALVGDAAHTTHPLAGQGLNAGLADGQALAKVLEEARRVGSDLGGITALAQYPRDRYLTNHILLAAVDKLNSVFGARNPLINWARANGLEVFNELGPIKDFFMRNAGSGIAGKRTQQQREFGRARAEDKLNAKAAGAPAALADAVEGLDMARRVASSAGGVIAEGLKNLLRRGADSIEHQQRKP
ncbi:ubiquinone biosynthesis monooxygenase [Trichosporon asahii var. asahii CBS 8904]|uniref:Ubiquinone biosynthesis monooxygenase COQ6, mitochondrial n=1 Tax=Trichosporon asahii var. asahii (strain CBS 8904) TaxID=1220162 RepID=K1WCM6_TRIAC|nr:ubiquinone biosynthesis monooxygenase [Trichosporon asahii var. asahii CBS 8904]